MPSSSKYTISYVSISEVKALEFSVFLDLHLGFPQLSKTTSPHYKLDIPQETLSQCQDSNPRTQYPDRAGP